MTDEVKLRTPTQKEKVAVYENLLHNIQMNAEVNMNEAAIKELIRRICAWSYAHRSGNGELTEKQQQERIDHAFWKFDIRNEFKHAK